jgi:hypothetical protein
LRWSNEATLVGAASRAGVRICPHARLRRQPETIGHRGIRVKARANGRRVSITGLGSHVPERVVTNDEMAQIVDTTDEWISSRTGIKERRIAAEDEAM